MARKVDFQTLTIGEIREWLQKVEPTKKQLKELLNDSRGGVQKAAEAFLRERERRNKEAEQKQRMWAHERKALAEGYQWIAGIDEAGRGPLAGPVVAGCVILPQEIDLPGLNDSKQVKEETREWLYDAICQQAVAYGIGIVDVEFIDEHNILQATFKAARQALSKLQKQFDVVPDFLVTDFLKIPDVTQPYEAIVKGDASSFSIAAASILAKVTRDRLMVDYAAQYPQYGFEKHKGYSTPEHLEALDKYGPCPLHRKSFAPVQQRLQGTLFDFSF